MIKRFLLILILTLYSCTDDTCFCTETVTDIRNNIVYVDEYMIECDNSYTILETYEWGNVVTDCR